MTENKTLELETQEVEAAIKAKHESILFRVLGRLEQRKKTGHPITLNATEVKHLWQQINTESQYRTYLEQLVHELQATNKALADMVNSLQPKSRRIPKLLRSARKG